MTNSGRVNGPRSRKDSKLFRATRTQESAAALLIARAISDCLPGRGLTNTTLSSLKISRGFGARARSLARGLRSWRI